VYTGLVKKNNIRVSSQQYKYNAWKLSQKLKSRIHAILTGLNQSVALDEEGTRIADFRVIDLVNKHVPEWQVPIKHALLCHGFCFISLLLRQFNLEICWVPGEQVQCQWAIIILIRNVQSKYNVHLYHHKIILCKLMQEFYIPQINCLSICINDCINDGVMV